MLTVHFLLGEIGYGRAMVGDWWRAALYFMLYVIGIAFLLDIGINPVTGMELNPAASDAAKDVAVEKAAFGLILGFPSLLIGTFWWLADFYFLAKKIRAKNLKKILGCL